MLKRPLIEGHVYVRRDGLLTAPIKYDVQGRNQPAPQDLQFYDPCHRWYYDAWGNTNIDPETGHPADLVAEFTNDSGNSPQSPAETLNNLYTPCRAKIGDSPGAGVAVKHDNGKAPYDILPLDLLEQTAVVFGKGAVKYGRENFRKGGGFEPHRPLGAALRHLAEVQRAIETNDHERMKDAEWGTPHLAHAICSLLILTDSLRQRGWKV